MDFLKDSEAAPNMRPTGAQQCGLERALIAEAEEVGPLTVQDIQRVFSALTPPDVASQRCDDALFSSIGLLRALGRSDQTVHVAISELEYVRQFVSTLTHLAAENALLREREGWKFVPVESTWEMQIAGRDALLDTPDDDSLDLSTDDAGVVYAAMLAASPSHQEQNNG